LTLYSWSLDCPPVLSAPATNKVRSNTIRGTIERLVRADDGGSQLGIPGIGPELCIGPDTRRPIQNRHVSLA